VSVADIDAQLTRNGITVNAIETVMPSLEDVFLDVVERAGGTAA
jgi:hypothetical protein